MYFFPAYGYTNIVKLEKRIYVCMLYGTLLSRRFQ